VDDSGITASDGTVVSIERGANGDISRIVAPDGSQPFTNTTRSASAPGYRA